MNISENLPRLHLQKFSVGVNIQMKAQSRDRATGHAMGQTRISLTNNISFKLKEIPFKGEKNTKEVIINRK